MQNSCIINQFSRLAELTSDEKELLLSLENSPQNYPANSVIRLAGTEANAFFTLRSGWAMAVRELADGQRQVLDIFLPGQVMGLREIGYDNALSSIIALSDSEVCTFPKSRLSEIFDQAPRLCDLFFLVLAREQSMLIERVINMGCRPAAQRLGHFLIEMQTRLNQGCQSCEGFELPMTQSVIGDTLGLTSVHVSRTLKVLRDDGLVSIDDNDVHIQDYEKLLKFAEFNPGYLEHDISWLRQATSEGL